MSEKNLLKEIESLKLEIKKLKSRKKYGLVWEEKPEAVVELCKNKLPVLVEDSKKEIATDKNKPVNILIEGDNYHALSVLNYTHQGRIDVIYIDPPYNTGNKDFIFNDKYVDLEDSYRHSKWLSFISKRMKLAKNLLKETGIIFISIDDNEVAQLKMLMDDSDLFREGNFIGVFIWRKKKGGGNDAKFMADETEYIIVYAKNAKKLNRWIIKHDESYLKRYKEQDNYGRFFWDTAQRAGLTRPIVYEVKAPDGTIIKGNFIMSKKTFENNLAEGKIRFIKLKSDKWSIQFKQYMPEGKRPRSLLPDNVVGTNSSAKQQIENLFHNPKYFSNPKPTELIKYILDISNKDALVLDFMAGSGTTGQAVLELNREDNGNRKFILCTNNENKIAEKICYPRVKKVIEGYKDIKGNKVKGLGGNLKYYKTDFVEAKTTDSNKKKLVDKSTEMLCLKEDCFNELKRTKTYSIFTNNQGKFLGIIYDDAGIEPFKKEVKNMSKRFIVYVFSLDESAREEEFEDVAKLVELKPIPAVILNVYKRIFK